MHRHTLVLPLLALLLTLPTPAALSAEPAQTTVSLDGLHWASSAAMTSWTLRVSTPDGTVFERSIRGTAPSLSHADIRSVLGDVPDGAYSFEILGVSEEEGADSSVRRSGGFRILDGRFVHGEEPAATLTPKRRSPLAADGLTATAAPGVDYSFIDGDLTVHDSLCVGSKCEQVESFGVDTVRLREDSLRMVFYDSTDPSFGLPYKDWEIQINDLGFGLDKFSIRGVDDNTVPFTLVAGAPDDSIYVDSQGRVGLGTAVPDSDLHVFGGNGTAQVLVEENNTTAGDNTLLALESNGSVRLSLTDNKGTFSDDTDDSTWFVQNSTTLGENLLLSKSGSGGAEILIRPRLDVNGPTLDVDGTVRSAGSLKADIALDIERPETTAANRTLARFENNGPVSIVFDNTDDQSWHLANLYNGLALALSGSGINEFLLDESGNLTIAGTLTENSNRETKTNIKRVDPGMVLERLLDLPIATWERRGISDVTHLGPMAQDFRALFGLGVNETSISPVDMAGVALAAIQGLQQENRELRQRVEELEGLEERLAALEARAASP